MTEFIHKLYISYIQMQILICLRGNSHITIHTCTDYLHSSQCPIIYKQKWKHDGPVQVSVTHDIFSYLHWLWQVTMTRAQRPCYTCLAIGTRAQCPCNHGLAAQVISTKSFMLSQTYYIYGASPYPKIQYLWCQYLNDTNKRLNCLAQTNDEYFYIWKWIHSNEFKRTSTAASSTV